MDAFSQLRPKGQNLFARQGVFPRKRVFLIKMFVKEQ
jgi:hypothetical protein